MSSKTYTVITNTRSHHKHTQSSQIHAVITNTRCHHKHTQSSQTYAVITNTHSHHKHTQSSLTHTVITHTHSHHKHTLLQSFCISQSKYYRRSLINILGVKHLNTEVDTYVKEVYKRGTYTYAYLYTFVVCTVCVVDQHTYIHTYVHTYVLLTTASTYLSSSSSHCCFYPVCVQEGKESMLHVTEDVSNNGQ